MAHGFFVYSLSIIWYSKTNVLVYLLISLTYFRVFLKTTAQFALLLCCASALNTTVVRVLMGIMPSPRFVSLPQICKFFERKAMTFYSLPVVITQTLAWSLLIGTLTSSAAVDSKTSQWLYSIKVPSVHQVNYVLGGPKTWQIV